MRRSTPLITTGGRSTDPYQNLTPKQLELIGAVAMIYNDAEQTIIDICRLGLQLPIDPMEVLARINGIEGVANIAKKVCERWGFTAQERAALGDTLGEAGFLELKRHRDGVIHARVYDASTSIGKSRQGKGRVQDVLLAEAALQGLYDRLKWFGQELRQLDLILAHRHSLAHATIDQERERHEAKIQVAWSRYQQHRNRRLSLPPLPEFPPEPSGIELIRNALDRARPASEVDLDFPDR
jgi:hypothetical protein